jgi:hypothetical protein
MLRKITGKFFSNLRTLEWKCIANYRKGFPCNSNLSNEVNGINTNRTDAIKQNEFINRSLSYTSCKLELILQGEKKSSIPVTVSPEAWKDLIVLSCATTLTLYVPIALTPALPNIMQAS